MDQARVIALPDRPAGPRHVRPSQAAIDALPPGTGLYEIGDAPGFHVLCGKTKRSYLVVRRVRGRLLKRTLRSETFAAARREAMAVWRDSKPRPPGAAPCRRSRRTTDERRRSGAGAELPEEAVRIYSEVVKLDPCRAAAWGYLGLAHYDRHPHAEAERAFARLVVLDRHNGAALAMLAPSAATANMTRR